METIRDRYYDLTGKKLGKVVVLQNGELQRCIDADLPIPGGRDPPSSAPEQEFLEILKTSKGYELHVLDLHRDSSGNVLKTYFEEQRLPEGDLATSLRGLDMGESITLHLVGKSPAEMAKKRSSYLSQGEEPSRSTPSTNSYEAPVEVLNRFGIHARPAALIVNYSNTFSGTDIYLQTEDGTRVSAKSILGVLTTGCPKGTKLEVIAEGPKAKEAVDGLVKLFQEKFNE